MGRSKKSGMNWLAWRLNNPDKSRAQDEAGGGLEHQVIGRVMVCRTCGTARTTVSADEVPANVRTSLESSMKIKDFVYCSTCKEYSGLGEWNSF
jgi:uncharacterized protein with PIN domain